MQIREATSRDIAGIVKVLQVSLGESLLPKNELIWKYKHLENPFGKSLVVIAVNEIEIIGVRAFMKWSWQKGDELLTGLRAVDTAILPEFQRQGIFRKLNSAAIEIAKSKGDHFVFNTPNAKSLPANLKMGSKRIDNLAIALSIGKLLRVPNKHTNLNYLTQKAASEQEFLDLVKRYNQIKQGKNKIFTLKSKSYLAWRYENNPLQSYHVVTDPDFYLALYVKKHKRFHELRICEHIYVNQMGLKKMQQKVLELNKSLGAQIISFSPEAKFFKFRISGKFGPVFIFRNINLSHPTEISIQNLSNWSYSLGDLELY